MQSHIKSQSFQLICSTDIIKHCTGIWYACAITKHSVQTVLIYNLLRCDSNIASYSSAGNLLPFEELEHTLYSYPAVLPIKKCMMVTKLVIPFVHIQVRFTRLSYLCRQAPPWAPRNEAIIIIKNSHGQFRTLLARPLGWLALKIICERLGWVNLEPSELAHLI